MNNSKDIKNPAFTLAEVLITLTIIGVIAALTIPALLQRINEQDLRTQWKAAYSTLDQATKRALMDNGGDLTGIFQNAQDMRDKLKGYFAYTKECTAATNLGNCWPTPWYHLNGASGTWAAVPAIVLNNGIFIRFWFASSDCKNTSYYASGECGGYEVDVNGFRGPNIVGKDIFWIHLLSNGIKSGGVAGSQSGMDDCSWNGSGCGALYLMQ